MALTVMTALIGSWVHEPSALAEAGVVDTSVPTSEPTPTPPTEPEPQLDCADVNGNGQCDAGLDVVASADVTMVDGDDDEIEFTVTVRNSGEVDLLGVTGSNVIDSPAYPSGSPTACVLSPDSGVGATLSPGETSTYSCTYDVLATDLRDGERIVNTATFVATYEVDGAVSSISDSDAVDVDVIVPSIEPTPIEPTPTEPPSTEPATTEPPTTEAPTTETPTTEPPLSVAEVNITVDVDATPVVYDAVDEEIVVFVDVTSDTDLGDLKVVVAVTAPSGAGATCVFPVGSDTSAAELLAGETFATSCDYTVVAGDIIAGGEITFAATVTALDGDVPVSVSGSDTVAVADPEIVVTKTAFVDEVYIDPDGGEGSDTEVEFEITVTNTGNVEIDYDSLTYDDTLTSPALPDGSDTACALGEPESSFGPVGPVAALDPELEFLEPGETWQYICVYTLQPGDAVDGGTISNEVTFTATYVNLADTDSASDSVLIDTDPLPPPPPPAPALSLTKSANRLSVSKVGDVVTYTVMARNTGGVALSNLTVADSLAPACSLSPSGERTLPVGESAVYTCTYTVTQANLDTGSIVNVATATARDGNGTVVTARDDASVSVYQRPAIDVVKTADPTVVTAAGQTVTFTVKVTNTGNVTLGTLTVTDNLGDACALAPTPQSTPSRMLPGDVATYTCEYTVTEANMTAGRITNVADASAVVVSTTGNRAGDTVTDWASAVVLTEAASIQLEASVDMDVAEIGDSVRFRVKVTNTGDVTLRNLTLTDSLDRGCELTRVSGHPVRIRPGATAYYLCDYDVTARDVDPAPGVDRVTNVIVGTAVTPRGAEVTDEDEASFVAAPPVDVALEITNRLLDPATGRAVWDITVMNKSSWATAGPVVVNVAPPTGSRVEQDLCQGDQPWKQGTAGKRSWTCRSAEARSDASLGDTAISATRERGLAPNESVSFVVITRGGDLGHLVMRGSVSVPGDTDDDNDSASNTGDDGTGDDGTGDDGTEGDGTGDDGNGGNGGGGQTVPTLPATGWDPMTGLAVAVVLLIVGGALVVPSRRRSLS